MLIAHGRETTINRKLLKGISGLGVVFFGLVFLATFLLLTPLEKTAVEFLTKEVTTQVNTKVDKLLGIGDVAPNVAQKLFLSKYEEEVPLLKADIERISTSVNNALLQKEDTTPADIAITKAVDTMPLESRLWDFKVVKAGVDSLGSEVVSRYKETLSALVTDIRIFSAVNVGSFCLVLLLVMLVKEIPRYLSFCTWILVFSTVVSISIYIYGQNWFYTILFNQYYGTGYLTMLSCIFGYLLVRLSIEYGIHSVTNRRKKGE